MRIRSLVSLGLRPALSILAVIDNVGSQWFLCRVSYITPRSPTWVWGRLPRRCIGGQAWGQAARCGTHQLHLLAASAGHFKIKSRTAPRGSATKSTRSYSIVPNTGV